MDRTITTATWLPFACSKARSFASSAATWSAASVPVVSVTGEVSGGTATSDWAGAAGASNSVATAPSTAATAASQRDPVALTIDDASAAPGTDAARAQFVAGAGAGVEKSTVGGLAIAASFSTVKFGLTL